MVAPDLAVLSVCNTPIFPRDVSPTTVAVPSSPLELTATPSFGSNAQPSASLPISLVQSSLPFSKSMMAIFWFSPTENKRWCEENSHAPRFHLAAVVNVVSMTETFPSRETVPMPSWHLALGARIPSGTTNEVADAGSFISRWAPVLEGSSSIV
jgi:hypothetical protein